MIVLDCLKLPNLGIGALICFRKLDGQYKQWANSQLTKLWRLTCHTNRGSRLNRQTDRQTDKQTVNKHGPFFSHPVDKSNHMLVGQSVSQSVSRSVSHSVSHSVTQSLGQSVRQWLGQSGSYSVSHLVSQWLGQSYLMTDQLFQYNQHIIHEYLDVFQSASD